MIFNTIKMSKRYIKSETAQNIYKKEEKKQQNSQYLFLEKFVRMDIANRSERAPLYTDTERQPWMYILRKNKVVQTLPTNF